jgi:hypothetical protein
MTRKGPRPLTLEEFTRRFWARVDSSGGPDACWPWTGGKGAGYKGRNYGIVQARGLFGPQPKTTHTVAFWLTHGCWPTPECLHSCDNYPCCNPAHLSAGTHRQNMHDAIARGRLKLGGRTSGTWSVGDTRWTRALKITGKDH